MRTWFLRLLGAATVVITLAVLTAWLSIRGSLPQLDGELAVEGIGNSVRIERDDHGVPTITAVTRADLAFGTGLVHAQDRFFQMDLIRRQAAGELSALFGPAAIDVDKRYRFHRFRARAKAAMQRLDADETAILEAYAKGVNAGLDSLSVRPFEYLLMRAEPRAWTAEDSILVVYAMFMQLNDDRARRDVRRGLAKSALPADVYAWLYPDGTDWDAAIVGEPRSVGDVPSAEQFSINDRVVPAAPVGEEGRDPLNGSNNWAVSGALTGSGRALVSNDMHLALSVPNIYYQARLVTTAPPARDVTGVSLPGTPLVVAGSNGHVAWGYTNSYGDWSDAIVLSPGADDASYATADGDEAIVTFSETIAVKGADPVVFDIRETRWGPIDEAADFAGNSIAVRWLAHSPRGVNLRILGLETAKSLDEALDVANTMGMPPQNFVAGDADGNIGWTIAGQIPVRSGYDAMVPVDLHAGGGWVGWLDPGDYPRVINPVTERIWTANARVVDGDALAKIGDGGYDFAARARQIRDRLYERDLFTPEHMLSIQRDHEAIFLSRWRDLMLAVLQRNDISDDLADYKAQIENWIPAAAPDSVGYRLVRGFRWNVRRLVFDALMAPVREVHGADADPLISNQFEAPLWSLLNQQPEHLLPVNFSSWDELMLATMRESVRRYAANYPGTLEQRTWGEYNTARIQHPVSQAVPQLSTWLDMPRQPMAGDMNLPLAQGPDFGASQRFSVSPGDEANGLMQMPTGQSGHPMSPFYRRGHDDWVRGTPSPFLPGEVAHALTLSPAR